MFQNHALKKEENGNFLKHLNSYPSLGLTEYFLSFSLTTPRLLDIYVLLFRGQHDAILDFAELAQLFPADSSQFWARYFRQSSTQILAALAKATCLTEAPSRPALTLRHHRDFAWNSH